MLCSRHMQHSSSLTQQSLTCRKVCRFTCGTDSLTLEFCACRKALQLLRELMRQRPEDIREGVKEGLLRTLMAAVKSDQPDVREAALALLALLVQHPGLVTVAKQVSCICALS